MVIVAENNLKRANAILMKHNSKSVYSFVTYEGKRYAIFEKGTAAALLEIDMCCGCDYKEGRIIERNA